MQRRQAQRIRAAAGGIPMRKNLFRQEIASFIKSERSAGFAGRSASTCLSAHALQCKPIRPLTKDIRTHPEAFCSYHKMAGSGSSNGVGVVEPCSSRSRIGRLTMKDDPTPTLLS